MSRLTDYEGESISMAYDAYVERQYDEWCQANEEAMERDLEEQQNEQDGS